MTLAVPSYESSCLANYRLLHVNVHFVWFLYRLSNELVLVPIANALIGAQRDLASFVQEPEIQGLVS